MNTNEFEKKLIEIIYNTVTEYKNNRGFSRYKLEDFDNWKDAIIERVLCLGLAFKHNKNTTIKKVVITDDDSLGMDEAYSMWFYCPKCDCDWVRTSDNFCANCGSKIDWNLNKYKAYRE